MRALVLANDYSLRLDDLPAPQVRPDEVLIRVERAGVCGSDVQGVQARSERRRPPLVMGHEIVGVVERVGGREVESWWGKRVALNPQLPCRRCLACRSGREQLCSKRDLLGGTRPGGFAELLAAPTYSLHELATDGSLSAGCLVEPLAVCVHALSLVSSLVGIDVLVLGAGTLGMLSVQLCRLLGCDRIFVSEISSSRRAAATPIVEFALAPDEAQSVVVEETGGRGVGLTIDAVGVEDTRRAAVDLVEPGGTALWLGMHDFDCNLDGWSIVTAEKRVQGVFAYNDAEFDSATRLIARGRIVPNVPIQEVPLSQAVPAFGRLLSVQGSSEKVVFVPQ